MEMTWLHGCNGWHANLDRSAPSLAHEARPHTPRAVPWRRIQWALALPLLAAIVPAAADGETLVARAWLRGAAEASATAFFLPVPTTPGAVAVGASRTFDRTSLAESGEVVFRDADGREVARSTRLYARPGRPFYEPGATAADDYAVLALEAAPAGLRVLEPAVALPAPGDRVRLVGLPPRGTARQTELAGRVAHADAGEIAVDLDAPFDLRGWGGAPVLDASGRVLGLLQSARPGAGGRTRLGVGPVRGVVGALAEPYEAGLGRLFATVAPHASAANSPGARGRTARLDADPSRYAGERVEAATRALPAAQGPRTLRLRIEQPPPDAVVGDAPGVFVAGHAVESLGGSQRLDLVVVIDTSESTARPAGVDVDGDGKVGQPLSEGARAGSTDPGDSILAAEIAAAKTLAAGLDPRSTRVGVVTFAGQAEATRTGRVRIERAALTREPLTSDPRRLRRALDALREEGASGMTHMAAGIDVAILELLGLEGALSRHDPETTKAILFFTDGEPTLPSLDSAAENVGAVLAAAQRARRAGVRIDSFAIGPEALAGPLSTVEMASITDGQFTPLRHPGSLVRSMSLVSFARVESLAVRNLTTGQRAHAERLHADGSWDALVPLAPGANELEVEVRGAGGDEQTQRLVVRRVPGATNPVLPAELVSRQNALLEARLRTLHAEKLDRVRRELIIEIEAEREKAHERSVQQRKELRIEVEPPTERDRDEASGAWR